MGDQTQRLTMHAMTPTKEQAACIATNNGVADNKIRHCFKMQRQCTVKECMQHKQVVTTKTGILALWMGVHALSKVIEFSERMPRDESLVKAIRMLGSGDAWIRNAIADAAMNVYFSYYCISASYMLGIPDTCDIRVISYASDLAYFDFTLYQQQYHFLASVLNIAGSN